MAHVTLIDAPRGAVRRMAFRTARKQFGRTVEPIQAAAHHNGVLVAWGALEKAAEMGWRRLDPGIRGLVVQLTSARIGCSWCTDYGYYENVRNGIGPDKVRAVNDWRTSPLFDERERAALEFAEVATDTPVRVPDDLVTRLRAHFSEAEMVELASWVALENFRSRFNGGLGLRSQGFSDACEVPRVATS
ncbi:MAG: carboxymuconolactone decarboxylase family protein [Acidimicrobiales bacterium]